MHHLNILFLWRFLQCWKDQAQKEKCLAADFLSTHFPEIFWDDIFPKMYSWKSGKLESYLSFLRISLVLFCDIKGFSTKTFVHSCISTTVYLLEAHTRIGIHLLWVLEDTVNTLLFLHVIVWYKIDTILSAAEWQRFSYASWDLLSYLVSKLKRLYLALSLISESSWNQDQENIRS